jgi:hypothetical protein
MYKLIAFALSSHLQQAWRLHKRPCYIRLRGESYWQERQTPGRRREGIVYEDVRGRR